jgi:hypothetical protein
MGVNWNRSQGLIDHTVQTEAGLVAGLLLRVGGVDLGYVWCTGQQWGWRTVDGLAFGLRQSNRAAIDTLHDVQAVKVRNTTGAWTAPRTSMQPARPMAPVRREQPERVTATPDLPAAPAPARRVQWGDSASDGAALTSAIGAAFDKHKAGGR